MKNLKFVWDEMSLICKLEVWIKDKWYMKKKICKSFIGKWVINWFFKKYMYIMEIYIFCYNIKIYIEYFIIFCDDDGKWWWKRIILLL